MLQKLLERTMDFDENLRKKILFNPNAGAVLSKQK
jgi:hypothetical protein